MIFDAPNSSSLSANNKTSLESVEPLVYPNMYKPKDTEIPMSASVSQQNSGQHQKVGTYIIEKTIGKGNFSFVKLARHTVTNVKVAIKIIDKTKLSEENLRKAQREADILKSLHHPNIIKLYQVMESEKLLCIVTEYLPNGELYEYIANNGCLSELVARHKFLEILAAVEHCHNNNVVHRDLKAENMLLDQHMSIKLADFGFGTFQPDGPNSLLTTWCGSPPYAAPEIFKGEPYLGTTADIWSLGVILYVLVCGVLPFNAQEVSCLRRQVLEEHVRVPYWLSMSCEDLLKTMLAKSPSKRPTIAQIYRSKWLSEISDLGAVPIPLALDEPDSAQTAQRDQVGAAASSSSPASLPSTSYFRAPLVCQATPPTLAAEMKVGKLDQTVIQIMENSGIDRGQLLESLRRCAYDHLTATYLLLGESLRTNRHCLSQTMAPSSNEIETLMQVRQGRVLQPCEAQPQQQYSRSSCPSSGRAVDLLFQHLSQLRQQEFDHHLYFGVKDTPGVSPAVAAAATLATAVKHNHLHHHHHPHSQTTAFPSSHPHPGFLFGPTLPRVAEFGGLRRTDASPSPPESPINLSNRNTLSTSNTEGDCFDCDWFPYQSEGMGSSSPAPPSSSSFGGDLKPKQTQQTGRSPVGPPSLTVNTVAAANTIFPSIFPPESVDPLSVIYEANASQLGVHRVSHESEASHGVAGPQIAAASIHPHRRYSATGPTRLLHLPAQFSHTTCESQAYEKSVTDEHTSGLGSSVEADSHHSSFSQPATAPSVAFQPMDCGFGEDAGIDIPVRAPRKHISPHSPSPVTHHQHHPPPPLAALPAGGPRRKFGVIERPPALAVQLSLLQNPPLPNQSHLAQNINDPHQAYDMDF
uniref:non-specific serine/threonine protein kinase n=3 Tax=Mesocestoides corti TaxID=53468 RepID=A0A5K3FQX6_MESCO